MPKLDRLQFVTPRSWWLVAAVLAAGLLAGPAVPGPEVTSPSPATVERNDLAPWPNCWVAGVSTRMPGIAELPCDDDVATKVRAAYRRP